MEKINKQELLKILCSQVAESLELLIQTALEAKDAATNEESKAENKYDTRGLEASYLAGAQALRSAELKKTLDQLQLLKTRDFTEDSPIHMTALVKVVVYESVSDVEFERMFFLLPYAGGTKIVCQNREYFVVSQDSGVGRGLIGKRVGDSFAIKTNNKAYDYEILEVF